MLTNGSITAAGEVKQYKFTPANADNYTVVSLGATLKVQRAWEEQPDTTIIPSYSDSSCHFKNYYALTGGTPYIFDIKHTNPSVSSANYAILAVKGEEVDENTIPTVSLVGLSYTYFNGEKITSLTRHNKLHASLSEIITKLEGYHGTYFPQYGGSKLHEAYINSDITDAILAYFHHKGNYVYTNIYGSNSSIGNMVSCEVEYRSGTNWFGYNNKGIDLFVDYGHLCALLETAGLDIDTTPPPAAPSPYVSAVTSNSITVSWNSVSYATEYLVKIGNETAENVGSSLSKTFTGLTSETAYSIAVLARNIVGYSSQWAFANNTITLTLFTVEQGITVDSRALAKMEEYYNSDAALKTWIDDGEKCIFAFEGLGATDTGGNTNTGIPYYHPNGAYNAMMVVTEGRNVIYVTMKASTLPDCPATGGQTTKPGIYNYATGTHNADIRAIRLERRCVNALCGVRRPLDGEQVERERVRPLCFHTAGDCRFERLRLVLQLLEELGQFLVLAGFGCDFVC